MDQCRYKNTYDKNSGIRKCFKCGKEYHLASHFPEGNNKDSKKNSIEKIIIISPELIDPVSQASLTSEG